MFWVFGHRFGDMSAQKSAISTWLILFYYQYGSLTCSQPQHNTKHNTHLTQQPKKWAATLPPVVLPSISMGRAAGTPNLGATSSQCHTQVASHWACARCRWFINLGGQNERHQKIQRGRCLGLRWPPFSSHDATTNQMIVLVVRGALEIRCGRVRTCKEDVFPSFGATNWDRKK